MSDLKKNLNLPETYDPTHLRRVLEGIIDGTQSRYLTPVSQSPEKTDGFNGEMRIDHEAGKVYIKIKGEWKSITAE